MNLSPIYVSRLYLIVALVAVVSKGANVDVDGVKLGVVDEVLLTAVPSVPPKLHVIQCEKLEDARLIEKVYEFPIVCDVVKLIVDAAEEGMDRVAVYDLEPIRVLPEYVFSV